ncbi:uncharacterized protein LOC114184163 isoform X2 [Vigna unguiculata]|uniref:uncharacterized protein LOC114184163 isoform X2 n=1 Tax=Vigna unguiculata TaxID=3917 RepID=UPI0010164D19|nr:uncharacterized protein LOC114184163 isoform X2 [Vigna unguiculata]
MKKKIPFFLCFSVKKKQRGSRCKETMDTAAATLSLCQWPIFSSSPPSLRMHVRVSCRIPHLSASAVDKTLSQINNSGIIACLRANSAEVALKAANAAIAGGVSVLEIVVSTPGVFEVLQQLVKEHPTMTLGVGTVLKIEDAKSAINAGAKFLLSPATVKDIMVMDYVQSGEVLYIPGTMTPTEILSACDAGAKMVKVLPCDRYIQFLHLEDFSTYQHSRRHFLMYLWLLPRE